MIANILTALALAMLIVAICELIRRESDDWDEF